MSDTPRGQLRDAIERDDRDAVDTLLKKHDELAIALDAPLAKWGRPALAGARSVEMARLLIDRGATLDAVSRWWAPGFGVIAGVEPAVGRFLVEYGAAVSPHAAAALGLVEVLAEMIDQDPETVHAKGGDGCRPLAFARDVATAELLIDRGAELDSRDDDHNSTPAQWLIGERPDVARYIIERGATPDIFMAAALGDRALGERLIREDPACLALRVGKGKYPGIGHEELGGTILQWSLGFNSYAHQYALKNGHRELFEYLWEKSDPTTRLLVACVTARREEAERIAAKNPGIVGELAPEDLELVARYSWETNVDSEAVRLMLDVGFPIDHPEHSHGYSPLHNAAWGGHADLVDLLLERGAPVDVSDPTYHATPLGFALHCCLEDGRHPEGEYGRVVAALIEAGSPWDPTIYPTGDESVNRALGPLMRTRIDGAAVLGDSEAVEKFLAVGVSDDELAAALLGAVSGEHVELTKRLLERGASSRSTGENGITPVHRAARKGSVALLELLLANGADATARNRFGSTPFHSAALTNAGREVVEILASHGAKDVVNKRDQFGASALDLAVEHDAEETAAALRALGAEG